jgi:peptidoglycan/xylan/chitin deacetylase (PgdA/CDA1 family)
MRRPAIAAAVVAAFLAAAGTLVLAGCSDSGDATAVATSTTAPATTPHAVQKPPPSPRPSTGRPTSDPIPILMYHVIADPPAGAPFPELYVSGATFAGQVAWLAAHGYHGVTLQDAYDHWQTGLRLPARPIVVSFDDGYHSQFATAAPVLRRYRWPGVLNLEVRNTERSWGLSPRQVRLLLAGGWELDAHTLTHPDLTKVDAAQLEHEVAGSRAALKARFGVPVNFFCYPAGRLDDTVVAAVRSAGYLGATTTEPGLATPADTFRINRVRVDRSDGVSGLAAKLRAAGA